MKLHRLATMLRCKLFGHGWALAWRGKPCTQTKPHHCPKAFYVCHHCGEIKTKENAHA